MSHFRDFNSLFSIEDQFDIKELTRKPDTDEVKRVKSNSKDAYHEFVRRINKSPDYSTKSPNQD